MRPLESTLRSVTLRVIAPAESGQVLPEVIGGTDGTVRFVPKVSGSYDIVAGAGTERQSGRYALAVTCGVPQNFSTPDCVRQFLVCGQTGRWRLSDDACHFLDTGQLAIPYPLHTEPGDVVTWEVRSSAFPPQLLLYDRFGVLLAKSTREGDRAVLVKPELVRDAYLYVTSDAAEPRGDYEIMLSCDTSSCLIPIILDPPHDTAVPYGTRARLSVTVDAKSEVAYEWSDAEGLPVLVGRSRELVTEPVTRPKSYFVHVFTPCGDVISGIVRVTPVADHRRPARH
jgi:hypothetical protein